MRPPKRISMAILTSTALVIATGMVAAQLEISRSNVDGGGVLRSTGGTFELSGTIGQPDAGVMTGGDFILTGGFWFETPPGDCNQDGGTGLLDMRTFTNCMTGPASAPAGECRCFDVNHSGSSDLTDFAEFQTAFGGP